MFACDGKSLRVRLISLPNCLDPMYWIVTASRRKKLSDAVLPYATRIAYENVSLIPKAARKQNLYDITS